jgi:hypothetical protein
MPSLRLTVLLLLAVLLPLVLTACGGKGGGY